METKPGSPVKILVVEDDLHVATVLEARLSTFGYEVCSIAPSGAAAVNDALEHRPDLVLMDILLEGNMNGIEAAELICNHMDVPIVFITCLSDREMLDRAVKANAYGYIRKPYDIAELRHTVQIALIKHHAAKERERLIDDLNRNISDRKRAEEALRNLNLKLEQRVAERTELAEARAKQLQTLSVELIEAEERERVRIAQLLHDDLQQLLASAKMQLQAVSESFPPDPMLSNVELLLEQSIEKARRLSHELNPPMLHHAGLTAGLKWLSDQMTDQFGLDVHLEADALQPFESSTLKVFVFRAVQELLFNIVKHAEIKSASVGLYSSEDNLVITVCDQGVGFNPAILNTPSGKTGLGLLSIRERARSIGGSLEIKSAPGKGSRFTITVPLN